MHAGKSVEECNIYIIELQLGSWMHTETCRGMQHTYHANPACNINACCEIGWGMRHLHFTIPACNLNSCRDDNIIPQLYSKYFIYPLIGLQKFMILQNCLF